mgnify:CR=1 FL=1
MKKLLYPLFILFLVFACIQQEDITNIVGRWDVEQVFDENGDELVGSSIDCFKESYLVRDATGTGDFMRMKYIMNPFSVVWIRSLSAVGMRKLIHPTTPFN